MTKLPLLLLLTATAFAQPPIPTYDVTRAAGKITIDGKLDEPAWQKAAPVTFVFPWSKQTGAKQKTTARLLYDDDFLYVAYECEDSDIVAHYEHRDDPTYKDDAVEIFINPAPQQNFYLGLEMNARATLYDYFYAFPSTLVAQFDLKGAQLATNVRGTLNQTGDKDQGWSLEVAIPWENFRVLVPDAGPAPAKFPPPPGTKWRANMNRWDGTEPNRRLSEWSDSGLPDPNPHNPERFGWLIFR